LFIGALNDRLNAVYGEQAIRYSLLIVAVSSFAAGIAFWIGARDFALDMSRTVE
jgi:hypothetical protein